MKAERLITVLMVMFFVYQTPAIADARGQLLNGDGECYVHEYHDGEIVSLKVAPFADLHIEMPVGIYLANIGGGRLWTANYDKTRPLPHIWVKSKESEMYESQTTSLTILDPNLKSYHFVVNRIKNPGYTCAKIVLPDTDDMLQRLASWRNPESVKMESANRRIQNAEIDMNKRVEAIKEHAAEQIKTQRARLYTRYTWERDGSLLRSSKKSLIRSVMDDGIFTYVTLNDASSGLMSIYGIYGKKEHQVQMQYDPQLMQYTLTGVYNTIKMRYDDFSVEIKRAEEE